MEDGKKYIPNASVPISILFLLEKHLLLIHLKKIIIVLQKTAIKIQLIDGIVTDVMISSICKEKNVKTKFKI